MKNPHKLLEMSVWFSDLQFRFMALGVYSHYQYSVQPNPPRPRLIVGNQNVATTIIIQQIFSRQ